MVENRSAPAHKSITLNVAHFSLQVQDPDWQKKRDVPKIFVRGYDWVMGTEGGEAPFTPMLRHYSHENGYTFFEYKSNWISIKRSLFVPGSLLTHGETVMDNDRVVGKGHDPNMAVAQFRHEELGRIGLICSHYPIHGRPDSKDPKMRVNLDENRILARAINKKADELSRGKAIGFYSGDQNINDAVADTHFGGNLTSIQDELDQHEKTHWAQIDVVSSHNKDGRVKAKYVRALDDKELFMFSDHRPVEAGFEVRVLN